MLNFSYVENVDILPRLLLRDRARFPNIAVRGFLSHSTRLPRFAPFGSAGFGLVANESHISSKTLTHVSILGRIIAEKSRHKYIRQPPLSFSLPLYGR